MGWKVIKFLVGLLLLPVCIGMTRTLGSLLFTLEPPVGVFFSAPMWALGCGFIFWQIVYAILPRPTRAYVLAHELTHALWGMCMGARVVTLRVRRNTGSVTLSRTNFLISLAPYFFPLYTVLVVVAYYTAKLFISVERYTLFWLGLIGFTWGFHLTFTLASLTQRQSDIRDQGRLFSYTVIYCLNMLGLALGIVLVSRVTIGQLVDSLCTNMVSSALLVWRGMQGAVRTASSRAK